MFERRLQILIDEQRYRRISAEAKRRGSSVAAVIRDAIDQALPAGLDRRRQAARALLAAESVPVPDVDELKAELAEIRAGAKE